MTPPEKSKFEILLGKMVPTLRWRHYELTAEQARCWAVELRQIADLAEASWNREEMARESKEGR